MIRLLHAAISHARLRPRANSFRYWALYLIVPIEMLSTASRIGLLSLNRANVFSLRSTDYGDSKTAPEHWIRSVLTDWNIPEADGGVQLMTMPRMLGYVFNPVSFWFCFDTAGVLRAVLAEVRNTFGERHCYLCFHEDRRAIAAGDQLTARKVFHVSPFLAIEGSYTFHFSASPNRVAVAIAVNDSKGPVLQTSVAGTTNPLTSGALWRALIGNPLYPFKVICLIHFQALRLFLKGVRHHRKPPPPAAAISR